MYSNNRRYKNYHKQKCYFGYYLIIIMSIVDMEN
jgi:hypothetical protein